MKLLVPVIAAVLLFPISAFAQLSKEEVVNANYGAPAFLDAYWTDRTTEPPAGTAVVKTEVGPGDGASVLAVTLVNRGFSDITGITGRLTMPSGMKAAGTGAAQAVATHDNIVTAGGTFILFFQIDVSKNASITEYTTPLKVEYSRTLESGSPRASDISAVFKITGKTIIDASLQGGVAPGSSSLVPISITNTGSAPATGVVVTVPGTSGINTATQQAAIVALGKKTFELGTISPGESKTIAPTLYAANTSGEALQAVALNVTYGNAYGERKTSTVPVGLVVLPETASSPVSISPVGESSVITAGRITNLTVSLVNNRSQELSDVVVSVSSQSDSIKILGYTSWTIGDVPAGASQEISTKVFASEDMIGKAASFVFTVQHLSAGQPEIENISLGTYVDGEISIKAYEIGVTYIGGRPNITGNLLNEGNTVALFTTVQLTSADKLVSSLPPQQYLGDLTENSPLPFSIPVDMSSSNPAAGSYPITIKVAYKDSLRNEHEFVASQNVVLSAGQSLGQAAPVSAGGPTDHLSLAAGHLSGFMGTLIPIIAGVGAAAGGAIFFIKRRSKSKLKQAENILQNIDAILDEPKVVEKDGSKPGE